MADNITYQCSQNPKRITFCCFFLLTSETLRVKIIKKGLYIKGRWPV